MGKPIATNKEGFICHAFPDICKTPVPIIGEAPIPYVNIGRLSNADPVAESVFAEGNNVIHLESEIDETEGDEAGINKGIITGEDPGQGLRFVTYSQSVFVEGKNVVRMFDTTIQNTKDGVVFNAVGQVLGGAPSVLVGD